MTDEERRAYRHFQWERKKEEAQGVFRPAKEKGSSVWTIADALLWERLTREIRGKIYE